jgi:hypothetical protein
MTHHSCHGPCHGSRRAIEVSRDIMMHCGGPAWRSAAVALSASLALLVVVQLHSPPASRVRLLSASPSTVCAQPLSLAMIALLSMATESGRPALSLSLSLSLSLVVVSARENKSNHHPSLSLSLSSPPPSPLFSLSIYLSQSSQLLGAVASVLNLGNTDDAPLAPLRDQVRQLNIKEAESVICCHRERQREFFVTVALQ